MNNNRPLSTRKTIQLLVIITILAGATQTMVKQLGAIGGPHMLLAGVLSSNSAPALPAYHFEQGRMENTGNPLDIGIEGNGFFRVSLVSGNRPQFGYTRVGQLFVDSNNHLVVAIGGAQCFDLVPRIIIPEGVTDIRIGTDGFIDGVLAGQVAHTQLGQFKLTRFANPDGLREVQDDVYQPTTDSGPLIDGKPDQNGFGDLLQNYLESLARN